MTSIMQNNSPFLATQHTSALPSYEACQVAALALNKDSPPQAINDVLTLVQRAELDPLSRRGVVWTIASQTGSTLGSLKEALGEIAALAKKHAPDVGHSIAQAVLERYFAGGDHLIRGAEGCFWYYTGTHWSRMTDEQLSNKIIQVIEGSGDLGRSSYKTIKDEALSLLKGMQALEGDRLGRTELAHPVINCQNGELWIAEDGSVELRPHRFDSYLTSVIEVDYKPGASAPRFQQALLEIFAGASDPDEMARHFMELFGYAIQPRRDIPCYFLLYGQGANGKSKLIETLLLLVGQSSALCVRISSLDGDKFGMGALVGKLVLIDDDVDVNAKLPDGTLKKISEAKVITGQRKYQDSFEFKATCVPILLANTYPQLDDLSLGQRRRAKVIPFERTFSEEERDEKLFPAIWAEEISGVLNLAIEGLRRLRRRGAFAEPRDCDEARNKWMASANATLTFVDEQCQVEPNSRILERVLYQDFEIWAGQAGIRKVPPRSKFRRDLESLGHRIVRSSKGNMVKGIKGIRGN